MGAESSVEKTEGGIQLYGCKVIGMALIKAMQTLPI